MKNTIVALAIGLAAWGAAAAEITKAQIDRLVAAKNLTVLETTDDTVVVRAPTGDQVAIGLIDELGDGRRSILAFLGIYQNSRNLPPAAFNIWNTMQTYKGFLIADKAGVMQINVAVGGLPDQTVFTAWDMFLAETQQFRSFLYGASNNLQNSASLVGEGMSPRQMYDAGLSRAEVTARDQALTAHLNKAPTEAAPAVLVGLRLTDAQRQLFSDDSILGVNTEQD